MDNPATEGVLRFCVEMNVDLREMRDWEPGEIRAFFNGLALTREAAQHARARIRAARQVALPALPSPPEGRARAERGAVLGAADDA